MERTPIALWGPYTYLVGANDQWGSIYHLMNETAPGTPPRPSTSSTRSTTSPAPTPPTPARSTPTSMDITGCGNSTYDVPGNGGPGSVHTRSRHGRRRGRDLVFTGGHLHEGGIDITWTTAVEQTFCTGTATYHENPRHLATINQCLLHHKVVAGHDFTVTARYDNSNRGKT